jgi:uncharacterized protein with NRDE domain
LATDVCLLIVLSRLDGAAPLVVAANRDEKLDRPAVAATVLAESGPRVLGGRDELAGGTWLAVNEHGVVAGLTNRPSPGGRDPAKRSRGELPMALARNVDAASAVAELARRVRSEDYNAAWLLVGDRRSLYYVVVGGSGAPEIESLGPGLYVLGNDPLHSDTPKTDQVRDRVRAIGEMAGDEQLALLRSVLAEHTIPPGVSAPAPESTRGAVELAAACVHTDGYGTRSSALIRVPAEGLAQVSVADGPPCRTPFVDLSALWSAPTLD